MSALTVLSLFSGIGGIDLGLQRAGMRIVGQVEIDTYCRRVLARHWPEVPRHDDVRTAANWWHSVPDRPRVDVVAGGFPCQPSSNAGRRLGPKDERWLWPAMADVIAAVRPTWVLWENVPGLRTRGLDLVHADLVRLGYRHRVGWASACAVGAPHARRRLLGLAHTDGLRRSSRLHQPRHPGEEGRQTRRTPAGRRPAWPAEPDLDRVAYGVPRGMDRRTALGNAVVPAVIEHLGHLITATAFPRTTVTDVRAAA
ncbi:DNA cytosine methyltransferase [Jiangella muralis]|uniref:DNA cytosine methyltransferase n=1 Tax=Jiangella muralis TaxID=702383 RepID=UPI0009FA9323|nr:DNA cytosine methyltransferase [Jiangella muralis]